MGAAAAPLAAEAIMAESFAVAAPTMFTAVELAPLAAPTFGGLSALGTEFGTEALFSGLGAEGFGGLSALGSEFGTEALFGGLSEAAVPTLSEGITQGVTQGFGGAGEAGINEALVNAEQVQAARAGESLSDAALKTIEEAKTYGPAAPPEAFYEDLIQQNVDPSQLNYSMDKVRPDMGGAGGIKSSLTSAQSQLPSQFSLNQGLNYASPMSAANTTAAATNPLTNGFNTAMDFAKNNPFSAASMAYTASNLLKKPPEQEEPEEYNGILKRYKMSPNFQGRQANPADFQYTTKTYADGGIASFRSGGKSDSLDPTGGSKIAGDYYESMLSEQARNMPSTKSDPGIIYDTDPDTRSLDPVSAAQIRMAKINKRSNIQAQNMKRPTRLGQINLSPPGAKAEESSTSVDAARGGIMQSSLGSYAAGGNPRLLKGPGDGMSDNIPATIAGKQPARLADGEFVIPADVVSHLGNGSTEAGAKILHEMMNKVRRARTGNFKQGKQINPRKFVPT